MGPVCEGFHKVQDFRRGFARANFIHYSGAYNRAISHGGDIMRILRRANAKSNNDRQIGGRFDTRDLWSHIVGLRGRSASDAID
jgi:hypothetical protein